MDDLRHYLTNVMSKRQFGFVPNCGIDTCKEAFFAHISEKVAARKNPAVAFIDMSSAYNRVNLSKLYSKMATRKILTEEKLNLLKFIHKNVEVTLGNSNTTSTNGVPQGLTTSPACFDIFI
jgi:hypothetical protein